MDINTFLDLVRRMRQAQIAYYKQRNQSNLIAAKDLEKQVDRASDTIRNEANAGQIELFQEEG